MNTRSIQTIVLAAALAMLAHFFQPAGALAMRTPCCCTGDACTCCCCSPRQAPDSSEALFLQAASSAGDCSCSSGPNPYGRDSAACSIAAELKKKRHLQHNAPLSCSPGSASFCSTLATADKPPPRTGKHLYLLHRSLLI